LQEGIDIAVILNALRALRPGEGDVRLAKEDAALVRRFQDEHLLIRADLDQLRSAADALGRVGPAEAMAQVRRVQQLLLEQVKPHEEAEEQMLYPVVGRALGGSDPTGTMSRAHVEIAHQIRRLGQMLDDIAPTGPDQIDVTELRRILYGLHAILSLHTAQEDESYLSLGDEPGPPNVAVVEP
jgi:iron-sulfur cluster repair protein YtfE (RIC family)